jgi:IS30 family transposase
MDRRSRPNKTRSTVDDGLRPRIVQLRRARTPMRTIARVVGRSLATISRVLARLDLSSLKAMETKAPVVRYE